MKKLKLLSLALTLPLLALINVKPASAACGMIISIDDAETEISACTGYIMKGDTPVGFTYDSESHIITLDGFNGKIEANCMGTCGEEYGGAVAPSVKIISQSTVNGLTYLPNDTATITEITTQTVPETTSTAIGTTSTYDKIKEGIINPDQTNCAEAKTLCAKPATVFEQIASMPLLFIMEALIVAVIVCVIMLIIQKIRAKKSQSQTPPTPETPQTPTIG